MREQVPVAEELGRGKSSSSTFRNGKTEDRRGRYTQPRREREKERYGDNPQVPDTPEVGRTGIGSAPAPHLLGTP